MEKKFVLDLAGEWKGCGEGLGAFTVILPGTLDTNGVGHEDEAELSTRLTRLHTYEGEVHLSRKVMLPIANGKRLFLDVERARMLRLLVDGKEIAASVPGSLSTPYSFEITQFSGNEVLLELVSDNRYEGWSRKSVIGASAVTDETQTNWNGILGSVGIRMEEAVFLEAVRVYPGNGCARVEIDVNGSLDQLSPGSILLECSGFEEKVQSRMLSELSEGEYVLDWALKASGSERKSGDRRTLVWKEILLDRNVLIWDEEEGNLCRLKVTLKGDTGSDSKLITFGVRDFGYNKDLRLTINHRVFFLRGEANCCVFPEEGHPPMTVEEWKKVLSVYASYGVNCMRFHSWCPPVAAFTAADEMGMMMQPELSHWNCKDAFEDEESCRYFELELRLLLRMLANHPSFVMFTFGNELQADDAGHASMDRLIRLARSLDETRLYANSSNGHYGGKGTDKESDFYTSARFYEDMLRATSSPMIGHLNQEYPDTEHNFTEAVKKVHENGKPVFGFEVGQYEVLPDFKEIQQFRGVTRAVNYEIIKNRVEKAGLLPDWEKYVEATGELSLLGYREEVEAVLRTPGMSGLSLLGLQDFPGQGTAVVGMLNCHLEPKPYDFARPERFRRFFASVVPLLLMKKYTYESGEELRGECKLANYGKKSLKGSLIWRLKQGEVCLQEGSFEAAEYENQGLRDAGLLRIPLGHCDKGVRLDVELELPGVCSNSYPIWLYPKYPVISEQEAEEVSKVRIISRLTREQLEYVLEGGTAYIEPVPEKENLPDSIGGQFSTDFWSVGTFPEQEGGMGMVIQEAHPVFKDFPTEAHSDWQWWVMAGGRPLIVPHTILPIITVPDSYSRLKSMGLLFEARLGKGIVMVSGMGLLYRQEYPEARSLLNGILAYLSGNDLNVRQEISSDRLEKIVKLWE